MLDSLLEFIESIFSPGALRRAIYGGFFASLGATLGWVVWASGHAFRNRPNELLKSILVGAVLGILFEQVEHYVREARQYAIRHSAAPAQRAPRAIQSRLGRLSALVAWATGATAVIVTAVTQSLLPELVEAVIKPFVASVVLLFPVGAVFALVFHAPHPDDAVSPLDFIFGPITGAVIGCAAALVANAMCLLMGTQPSNAMFGWWALAGCGMGFMVGSLCRPHASVPIVGMLFALGLNLLALQPIEVSMRHVQGFGAVSQIVPASVEALLTGADVPARFWLDAEVQIMAQRVTNSEAPSPSMWGDRVAGLLGCDGPAPGWLTAPPPTYFERRARICASIRAGWPSGLWRSWMVLAFFGAGLSLAKIADDLLRPDDYEDSPARTLDRRAGAVIALVVLAAALLVRVL